MTNPVHPRVRLESPFPITELLKFEFDHRENEHARASFTALLDASVGDDTLYQRLEGVLVRLIDEQGGEPIFAGYIQNAVIDVEAGLYTLTVEALSGSVLLDQEKKNRSYQDVTLLYSNVLRMALEDFDDGDFIVRAEDKPIGIPLVQYAETAWAFAIRQVPRYSMSSLP